MAEWSKWRFVNVRMEEEISIMGPEHHDSCFAIEGKWDQK